MTQFEKDIMELNLLTVVLLAANDKLREKLEKLRRDNGECVECGKPVMEQGEEFCDPCYQKGMAQLLAERKHPDEK